MKYSNEKLKELLEELQDYKEVSRITGLTISALSTRNCRFLHVKMSPWTKHNTKYLIDNFSDKSDKELANDLGCTEKQVQSKARILKLKKSLSHIQKIQEQVSKNISSGPKRHSGFPIGFVHKTGPNNPRWVHDRTKIKGRRNKQFRFSVDIKKDILSIQRMKCNICGGVLPRRVEYDHIIPVVIGGRADRANCQALCSRCHYAKTHIEQIVSNNFKNLDKLKVFVTYEQYQFFARNLV